MTLYYRCRLCSKQVNVEAPEGWPIEWAPSTHVHTCGTYGSTGVCDLAGARAPARTVGVNLEPTIGQGGGGAG